MNSAITIEDVLAQLDTLPALITPRTGAQAAQTKHHRTKVANSGGKVTNVIFTARGNEILRWALSEPGHPETQNQVVGAAMELYEAKHRGGVDVLALQDKETLAKLDFMLVARCPTLTETELIGLAIRHLAWTFATQTEVAT